MLKLTACRRNCNDLFFQFSKDYETITTTERPVPPTISVVISSPVIQIIEVGETVRLPCKAYHNIRHVSFSFHVTLNLFQKNSFRFFFSFDLEFILFLFNKLIENFFDESIENFFDEGKLLR